MSAPAALDDASKTSGRGIVVASLGVTQIFAWGSSYYLPAVLSGPIAADMGWPLSWVTAGLSLGLLAAGLVSPRVGRTIERAGGRPVLALSSVLLGAGLLGLALAQSLPAFIVSWLVIGVGMGAGLYDAAFATLGALYGRSARSAIVNLTLFGGFASTIFWPLSAVLVEGLGWRGACLVYAGLQFVLALPAHLFLPPRAQASPSAAAPSAIDAPPVERAHEGASFILLATGLTLGAAISSVLSVHLIVILQSRGLDLAAAVGLGALIGPSQVGARLVEKMLGDRFHPLWTMTASTTLLAIGLGLLWADIPFLGLALAFYGAGVGLKSIARGSLPLALFGPSGYAVLMGRLAAPTLLAQAAAPSAGALMIERIGASDAIAILAIAAVVNVGFALMLFPLAASKHVESP